MTDSAESGAAHSGVVVVTGAGGGIGRCVVDRLAGRGQPVAALDLPGRLTLPLSPGVFPMSADVTMRNEVQQAVSVIESDLGPIEGLINTAGLLQLSEVTHPDDQLWADLVNVNATGVFTMITAVLPLMISRRRGSIVTISSNAAHVPRVSMGAYCASKAAATMFTKCAALEAAQYGIRCNIVSPGSTDTGMLRLSWRHEDRRSATVAGDPGMFRLGIPLGRIAEVEDIVDAVEFLLSDRARHITMHDMMVDGGSTLGA